MKDSPKIRWLTLLTIFLFFMFLSTEKADSVDPKDVCEEYGRKHSKKFADLCDGDKPKEPENNEKWKVADGEALFKFIKRECVGTAGYYWDLKTDNCEKIPSCESGQYFSAMYLKCVKYEGGHP